MGVHRDGVGRHGAPVLGVGFRTGCGGVAGARAVRAVATVAWWLVRSPLALGAASLTSPPPSASQDWRRSERTRVTLPMTRRASSPGSLMPDRPCSAASVPEENKGTSDTYSAIARYVTASSRPCTTAIRSATESVRRTGRACRTPPAPKSPLARLVDAGSSRTAAARALLSTQTPGFVRCGPGQCARDACAPSRGRRSPGLAAARRGCRSGGCARRLVARPRPATGWCGCCCAGKPASCFSTETPGRCWCGRGREGPRYW